MSATTIDQVARACNLTPQRVHQLVKQGILPREARGEYNIGKVLMAYVRYLQQGLVAKGSMGDDGEIATTKHQRSALLAVQLEREKLALAKERSEVMSIADYEQRLSYLIIETKARITAVGPRLAPILAAETNRAMILGIIDKAHKEAFSHLATIKLPSPAEPSPGKKARKKAN